MIRAVANKRLDLNDNEYDYYLDLKNQFGEDDFRQIFDTDKNGIITAISPPVDRSVSLGILFFMLNIMMNQRLRMLDDKIAKILVFEKNIDMLGMLPNIVERLDKIEKLTSPEENDGQVV